MPARNRAQSIKQQVVRELFRFQTLLIPALLHVFRLILKSTLVALFRLALAHQMSARHLCGAMFFNPLCLLLSNLVLSALAAVPVSPPSSPPTGDVIYPNFFGISVELSFVNYYFGNDTSTVPQPFINYLEALYARSSGLPVRMRLGGNSMDSSTYVPGQSSIIEFTNPDANVNDQPVNYGPQLFDVMNAVSDKVGGTEFLIGVYASLLPLPQKKVLIVFWLYRVELT